MKNKKRFQTDPTSATTSGPNVTYISQGGVAQGGGAPAVSSINFPPAENPLPLQYNIAAPPPYSPAAPVGSSLYYHPPTQEGAAGAIATGGTA